jgi:alginate O-acetyltransferase complex protein AlgF
MKHLVFNRRLLQTSLLALSLVGLQAQAGEAALYGPAAPKGSAFVRLYNAGVQATTVKVGSASITSTAPQGGSAFSFLPAGSYTAEVGGKSLPVTLAADQYYTLVNTPDTPRLVLDPAFYNRQKALVRLHNLTDQSLSLKTKDGATQVVEPVAPGKHGDREINPVKVSLALYDGEQRLSDVETTLLERGQVTALFVTKAQGRLMPVWVKQVKNN